MNTFNAKEFQSRLDTALARIGLLLPHAENNLKFAGDVHHRYQDKFKLAEFLGDCTESSIVDCFDKLGLSNNRLSSLQQLAKNRSITLRLALEEKVDFSRKIEREVRSDVTSVSKNTFLGTTESYTVTKVTDYCWSYHLAYQLIVYYGTEPHNGTTIRKQSTTIELVTQNDARPRSSSVMSPLDINITWFVSHWNSLSNSSQFTIDQSRTTCRTPRRNDQVNELISVLTQLATWIAKVRKFFTNEIFPLQKTSSIDLRAMRSGAMFVPILPLLSEEEGETKEANSFSQLLTLFLEEQQRNFSEKFQEIKSAFPSSDGVLFSRSEAELFVILIHIQNCCQAFQDGVDSIEMLLKKQLVSALGKEISSSDFSEYLRFHHRRIFRSEYQTRQFSFSIREDTDHDAVGNVCIEEEEVYGGLPQPIETSVCFSRANTPMFLALDAATQVQFFGERFLHGWLSHDFALPTAPPLKLRASARNFSAFILLLGNIGPAQEFIPKHGIIIKNKTDLMIPLTYETIPPPKVFADAIESLSPEQKRFAMAYRGMQLESSLFGLCVVQIRPQLEKLLNLPPSSLMKELELTEKLIDLLIEYELPPDQLSYDGPADLPTPKKIEQVFSNAQSIQKMIDLEKAEQLRCAQLEQQRRFAEYERVRLEAQLLQQQLVEAKRQEEEARSRAEEEKRQRIAEQQRQMAEAFARTHNTSPVPPLPTISSSSSSFGLNPAMWSHPTKQGQLQKRGHIVKNWKFRWFILQQDKLFYFKARKYAMPIDFIPLERAKVTAVSHSSSRSYCIEVAPSASSKAFLLDAGTREEQQDWLTQLRQATELSCVSLPTHITHNIHVDFCSSTGLTGLPPEWSMMLQTSGISRQEVSQYQEMSMINALAFTQQSNNTQSEYRGGGGGAATMRNTAMLDLHSDLGARQVRLDRLSARLSPSNGVKATPIDGKLAEMETKLLQLETTSLMKKDAQEGMKEEPTGRQWSSALPPLPASLAVVDYTKVPLQLDAKLLALDPDHAVSTAIIAPAKMWEVTLQKSLLSEPSHEGFPPAKQKEAKLKAFMLLDSLTRSGLLQVDCASLHVIIPAVHWFEDTLMNTLIKENINPIEAFERSMVLVAGTIHHAHPAELLCDEHIDRIASHSPLLFQDQL